jgi:hypothetical protein
MSTLFGELTGNTRKTARLESPGALVVKLYSGNQLRARIHFDGSVLELIDGEGKAVRTLKPFREAKGEVKYYESTDDED